MTSNEHFADIHVDVSHNQFHKTFQTIDELSEWIRAEVMFWTGLITQMREAIRKTSWNEALISDTPQVALTNLVNMIDKHGRENPALVVGQLEELRASIARGDTLVRGSTSGDRFLAMLGSDPIRAALAFMISPGRSNVPEVNVASIGNLPLWRLMSAYRLRYPASLEEVDVRSDGLAARQSDVAGLIAKLESEIARVGKLAQTLDTQLRLASPSRYWFWLSMRQLGWMAVSLVVMISIIVAGGYAYLRIYLVDWLPNIAQEMLTVDPAIPQSISVLVSDAPLFTFLAASVPLIVLLWFLRYPSKVFMQAVGLKADADHRAAMTKAYLTLSNEPSLLKSERETELILQALFRPGPVDTPEISPHESVASVLGQMFKKS